MPPVRVDGGMSVFARIVVGVDGTDWGFEALRQALLLAPQASSTVSAVTALDTAPAIHAGFQATHLAELLEQEAAEARDVGRGDHRRSLRRRRSRSARKPVDVLRRERDELKATLVALGGRRSSRFLGIMLGDTGTELLHDAVCSCSRLSGRRQELATAPNRVRARQLELRPGGARDGRRARRQILRLGRSRLRDRREADRGGRGLGRPGSELGPSASGARPRRAVARRRSRGGRLARRAPASAPLGASANESPTRRTARRSSFTSRRLTSGRARDDGARRSGPRRPLSPRRRRSQANRRRGSRRRATRCSRMPSRTASTASSRSTPAKTMRSVATIARP